MAKTTPHHARAQMRMAVSQSTAPWWWKFLLKSVIKKAVTFEEVCDVARALLTLLQIVSKHTKTEADDKAAEMIDRVLDGLGCE